MNLFRRSRPTRITRTFGRDSLLVWMNPLISALQASLGLRVGFRSEAEVLRKMEEDALRMESQGYRVVSAARFDLPVLIAPGRKANYYKVTYVLREDARTGRRG
jgi:hypothetical protein